MDTIDDMLYVVQQTEEFRAWHRSLRDLKRASPLLAASSALPPEIWATPKP
jgi:hypothetical protein